MNLDSLFTVAALLVAVYAIMPQHERLKLKMRFNVTAWLILIIPCVIILYMQFYPTFKVFGLTPNWGFHRWEIAPYNASFLVLTIALVTLYFYLRIRSLSISDIPKLHAYFLQLKNERKYNELFSFIEGNLDLLEKTLSGKFLRIRIRKYIEKKSNVDISDLFSGTIEKEDVLANLPSKKKRGIYKIILPFCPNYEREISLAKDICRIIQTDREIIAAMCADRSDIVISILRMDIGNSVEYAGFCLRHMIKDDRSRLCYEIQNQHEVQAQNHDEKNSFLLFLFDDCNVAYKLQVWRPIGEFVISELNNLRLIPDADKYNDPGEEDDAQHNFVEKLPLFIAVEFFDVMITSALKQNIKYNMWMMYFECFTNRILKNLNPNENIINMNDEFPTRYHRLLYEMVSLLENWSSSPLPYVNSYPNQEIPILDDNDPRSSAEEVIKSSFLTLAYINKEIIMSEKTGFTFKNYILGIVYRCYFELRKITKTEKYAETLRNAIRCGGCAIISMKYGVKETPHRYKKFLLDGLNNHGLGNREVIDYVVHRSEDIKELREILQEDLDSSETELQT